MRVRRRLAVALCWIASLAAAVGAEESLAARVILLANSEDPDSLRIARHYAEVRGVPAENIIALNLPLREEITWREFVVSLWEPLLARLVKDQWLDAIPMDLADAVGRKKYFVHSHRIAALVTCRGVPLKIADDKALFAEVPPLTRRSEFRTNAGAVDAELSALAVPNYPINAFLPNPLFQNDQPSRHDLRQVVKVSRLDGPGVEDALALVDRAVAAERTGLLGRAYVDIANRDPAGDPWLENTAKQLIELGFDTTVDRYGPTMHISSRFDAPVLYFGWYSGSIDGPFLLPEFQFPPGAIALHIYSFSASTLRQTNQAWTGSLVARGVTATVGNVYEPYLGLTHRPNLLLKALARGAPLVDAAYYSLQALSWQAVLIGDPLYRPFAVSLDEQIARIRTLPPALAGYAVLRQMRRLDASNRATEATALAIKAQHDTPSLAVGLALADRLKAAGDSDGAANALGFAPLLKTFAADDWAVAREVALLLEACGRPTRAVEVWRKLLAADALPAELRRVWAREASKCARASKDLPLALSWERLAEETSK